MQTPLFDRDFVSFRFLSEVFYSEKYQVKWL